MTVPAPIDRVHFLDEQRRNRRTGWVTAVLVALALMASGIPLSVLVSPALIAVALIVTCGLGHMRIEDTYASRTNCN